MTKNRKLRVLCLDIEGGHGGSSRSLFNSLSYLDRNKVNVDVWCRKKSAIKDRYRSIGISVDTISGMPKTSSLPRMSRNLFFLAVFFFYDWGCCCWLLLLLLLCCMKYKTAIPKMAFQPKITPIKATKSR